MEVFNKGQTMNKEQLDMRLRGFFKDTQEQSPETKHDHVEQTSSASDVHLSEILQPSTLIIGIIVLMLVVLAGWYILVLKPALNDNESMIHFMPPVEKQASNETAKPLAIAPNETLVPTPVPQSIAQPAPLSSESPSENQSNNPASNNTEVSPPAKNLTSKTVHVAKAKSINKSHHTHANRKQLRNKRTENAQHLPTLNEEQKCSPAQIAMQQCASYP